MTKLAFPKLFGAKKKNGLRKSPYVSRESIVAGGIGFFFCCFAAILFWSGFLFHRAVFSPRPPVPFAPFENRGVSSKKIDEVIRLLNERDQKLKEILHQAPAPASASSATTTQNQ